MIEELDLAPWQLAIIVFVSQTLFLWFRTLNVVYTARIEVVPAVLTGLGIGVFWLVAMTIGVDSVLKMSPLPIVAHLTGGALGTVIGLYKEKKKKDEKAKNGL